jgi:heterodisulfide reductase subunit C
VEIADLMLVFRNLACEGGYTPKSLIQQATSLIEKGCIVEVSNMVKKRRFKMGLPEISRAPVEVIKKIAEKTKLVEQIEKLRGKES